MSDFNGKDGAQQGLKQQAPSGLARFGLAVLSAWRPVPLEPPQVDPDLEHLSGLERITEVLRFQFLRVEAAVSPMGGLRAWLKLNLLVAAVLGIPALIVVPVVTYLLHGFATWSGYLSQIAENLLRVAVSVSLAALVLVVAGRILSSQLRSEPGRRRKRDDS